jgi:hypothetical protein
MVSMRLVSSGPVFDDLLTDSSKGWIDRRVVLVAGLGLEHTARSEFGAEGRILRVVGILRLFLGVEVVEIAEELIETMHRRQVFISVAKMILAELPGGVTECLHDIGHARVKRAKAELRAGQADFGQAGADRRLSGDERSASGGAALLAVPVGEHRALAADAVDVGRAVAHDAHVVGADVVPADVVAHDEQDVRLATGRLGLCRFHDGQRRQRRRSRERCAGEQHVPTVDNSRFWLRRICAVLIGHLSLLRVKSLCDVRQRQPYAISGRRKDYRALAAGAMTNL